MKTKDRILSILREADGAVVSGEDLAERCGVSRTAVWKAVSALRSDGYVLEAGTNRGYRLVREGESLDASLIERRAASLCSTASLCGAAQGSRTDFSGKVRVFGVTDSTNSEAKKALSGAAFVHTADGSLSAEGRALHGSAFFAETQTAGRGRLGRPFYSPSHTGLYVSLVYVPAGGVHEPALLTASAAVGVCRALSRVYGVDARIKWVNDVFLHGKKICGILTEGVSNFETGIIEAAVVGIGVNIAESGDGFPDQIARVAGTVLPSAGDEPAAASGGLRRNELAAALVYEVMRALDESGGYAAESATAERTAVDTGASVNPVMREYRERSLFTGGQELTVFPLAGDASSGYAARFVSIDDGARLIVELPDGTRRALGSGEVTLRSARVAQ
ncbi:biotin--[acetyl-CoA-carboxylase] ligase [Treponema brennaborense]|uniref:Bifunctional ligase/repressor BirA n=1 Tax=Treponema brennaborense (strain DSM 12168 / CIP 105900 / DD5/3) TaxID=906968 RepID=F4LNG8_TREBD|nr:biotin--[acetyl-CoA-carboxylase] ligase [Treponema brennaborense]AEE17926.1 biotin/acetyl-CoA-carboxylase ligase [Treponema brennaborense DSM 12168]